MGKRKKERADQLKEARKTTYYAKLNNCPTSPRKMRLVADQIRGQEVFTALNILKYSPKEASNRLEKLLTSAIANYESKSGNRSDEGNLYVKEIYVDSALQLKRLQTAPQGRAYRIRKRSNHVTLYVDTKDATASSAEASAKADKKENKSSSAEASDDKTENN